MLASVSPRKPFLDPRASFVISIASYPKRAHLLSAVFESVKRQTIRPRHIFLVLTEEEWPGKRLPKYLEKLEKQGVEILWVKGNPYSVKMLLPVVEKFPDMGVITLGDDWIYKSRFIEGTINSQPVKENCITGPLGKILYRKGDELNMFYRENTQADETTPSERVYIMGIGTYYPPRSLHPKMLNLKAVSRIIPGRGSDLWFWAAAIAQGSKLKCIGVETLRKYAIPIPLTTGTAPKDQPGKEEMNKRFNNTIDYFGIREWLLNNLPDKSDEDR